MSDGGLVVTADAPAGHTAVAAFCLILVVPVVIQVA